MRESLVFWANRTFAPFFGRKRVICSENWWANSQPWTNASSRVRGKNTSSRVKGKNTSSRVRGKNILQRWEEKRLLQEWEEKLSSRVRGENLLESWEEKILFQGWKEKNFSKGERKKPYLRVRGKNSFSRVRWKTITNNNTEIGGIQPSVEKHSVISSVRYPCHSIRSNKSPRTFWNWTNFFWWGGGGKVVINCVILALDNGTYAWCVR